MRTSAGSSFREDRRDRSPSGEVPALRSRPGGQAARFAGLVGARSPVAAFFAALIAAFVVLAAVSVALGLLVTDVLVPDTGLGRLDERVVRSIAGDRTPFLNDATSVGSAIGGAPVLPILVGLLGIFFAVRRRWRLAGFAVFVLAVESATYRVTSLLVPRPRPRVHRLEHLPANASYPSGHTAASVAVYAGLVLVLTSAVTNRALRVLAWVVAILIPLIVAASRMYRGMHHPLDVLGGVVVGIGAIAVLLFACRAAGLAAGARAGRHRTVRRRQSAALVR